MRRISKEDFWKEVRSHHDKEKVARILRVANVLHEDVSFEEIDEVKVWLKDEFLPVFIEAVAINGCSCGEDVVTIFAAATGATEIALLVDSEGEEIGEEVARHRAFSVYEKRCHMTGKWNLLCYCDEHSH